MSWLLAAAVLASTPEPPLTPVYTQAAVQEIGPTLQTGSLIFSKGDCLAIKVFTASPYTHVASVVVKSGQPCVYDTTGGPGTRCQPLDKYLASQGTCQLYILQPREEFSPDQARQFEDHLESQLGRPYAVRHHLTGHRVEGLHCAEYATDALMACELVKAKCPPKVSPASLRSGLLKSELYEHTASLKLVETPQPVAAPSTWYGRLWSSTKSCTVSCWRKVRGCVLCY